MQTALAGGMVVLCIGCFVVQESCGGVENVRLRGGTIEVLES